MTAILHPDRVATRPLPPEPERIDTAPPPPMPDFAALFAGLTWRQRQIVRLRCNGLTGVEAATELYVSVQTVKNHTSALLRAFGLHRPHRGGSGAMIRVCYELGRAEAAAAAEARWQAREAQWRARWDTR